MACGQLPAVLTDEGRIDDAHREYERAFKVALEAGDQGLAGTIEQHLGVLEDHAGHHEAANVHYRRALNLFLLAGNHGGAMRTRDLLGSLELRRGEFSAARIWYSAALNDAIALRQDDQEATTLHNLGALALSEALVARATGEETGAQRAFDDAAEMVQRSVNLKVSLGDEVGEALSWTQLGAIRKLQDRFAEARNSFLRGLAVRQHLGSVDIYKDYANLADVVMAIGNAEEAEQWRSKAKEAEATAHFLAKRPTFLIGFALIAAEARNGSLSATAKECDALASFPGWLGAIAEFFDEVASGASPPLPDGVPDEAADVIRRVLAGEDPSKVLADHLPSNDEPNTDNRPRAPLARQ